MHIISINSQVSLSNSSFYMRFEALLLLAIIEFPEWSSYLATGWTLARKENDFAFKEQNKCLVSSIYFSKVKVLSSGGHVLSVVRMVG